MAADRHQPPYTPPSSMQECLGNLKGFDWVDKVMERGRFNRMFNNSFVHDCDRSLWDEAGCEPIVKLVQVISQMWGWKGNTPEWMADWKPLRCYQHGDLNCANVLVDLQGKLWLID
eukprot:4878820-Prymnesium_polylepis.1